MEESENNLVDDIIANADSGMLDNRSYYWSNFTYPGMTITFDRCNFQHTISLGSMNEQSPAYIGSFNESLLLTWCGLECNVGRLLETSYTIKVNVVDGTNPYVNNHTPIFTYYKISHPINRFEPFFLHHNIATTDKIDTGQSLHVRVHSGYAIEIVPSYDNSQGSYLTKF